MAAPSRHPAARPVPQTDDYATRTPGGFTDPASGARVLKTRGLFRLRAQPLAGPPVGPGWGIVSNDRVNLSSSPLFTVLLLLVLRVGSIGLAQVLSLVFACAGLAVTYLATRAMTSSMTSCSSSPYPTPLPARCSRPNCGRTFATTSYRRLDHTAGYGCGSTRAGLRPTALPGGWPEPIT
jgi:hypothetical protein